MHLIVLAVLLLSLAGRVVCWGGLGHRTVGYLAEEYFTPQAVQLVKDLIRPNEHFDISDAAVWPDTLRQRRPWTSGWHFIDAKDSPPHACSVNFSRDCKQDKGCVISAIANQTSLLTSPSSSPQLQNEALKFLLHFIGDIHQPLHTEDLSRGGNGIPVTFDNHSGARINLHEVWDTAIPRKIANLSQSATFREEKPAARSWAASLAERVRGHGRGVEGECSDVERAQECALQWATETNLFVCSYVLAPGVEWVESNDLGGEYYDGAKGIVEVQIVNAGLRLAAWINAVAALKDAGGEFKEDL